MCPLPAHKGALKVPESLIFWVLTSTPIVCEVPNHMHRWSIELARVHIFSNHGTDHRIHYFLYVSTEPIPPTFCVTPRECRGGLLKDYDGMVWLRTDLGVKSNRNMFATLSDLLLPNSWEGSQPYLRRTVAWPDSWELRLLNVCMKSSIKHCQFWCAMGA